MCSHFFVMMKIMGYTRIVISLNLSFYYNRLQNYPFFLKYGNLH